MPTLSLSTSRKQEWVEITGQVSEALNPSGVFGGVCVVSSPHTTAGIAIQENADPTVISDCLMALDRLAPDNLEWRHAEGNSPAHLKTLLTGSSIQVPVESGRLALGTWQGIFFCEYDGPRNRRFRVDFVPSVD